MKLAQKWQTRAFKASENRYPALSSNHRWAMQDMCLAFAPLMQGIAGA
jgi:hypothetical protein